MDKHTLEPRPIDVEMESAAEVIASPQRRPSRRWRRYADAGILVALGAAILVAAQLARPTPRTVVATLPGATPIARDTRAPFAKLVVPATARPGELVPVVAYEPRDECTGTQLLLDGSPVPVRVTSVVDAPLPDWTGTVLALDLPATVAPGPHEVSLVGVLPDRIADSCASPLRHAARIAVATVTVGS